MPSPSRYRMSVSEAAERLGVTRHTIQDMIARGDLRARKVKGRGPTGFEFRIDPADLPRRRNGHAETAEKPEPKKETDPLMAIADDLIALGRRLRSVVKEHDAEVRRSAVAEIGKSLVEGATK